MSNKLDAKAYHEIASNVYCLEVGKSFSRSNVFFIRSGTSWVLIDAASANCGRLIQKTAESLFGVKARPASILLTHNHPDHAGSVLELLQYWDCLVYVHPDELPYSAITDLFTVKKYDNPLDRWIILPLFHLMPRQKVESMLSKSSLKGVVQGFDPEVSVPGLPDWKCIPTPSHTPGHVAFFRPSDRLLVSGDAVVTVDLNSLWGILLWCLRINKQKVSKPPGYSTWNKRSSQESVAVLASLKPRMLASGHGVPMTGNSVSSDLTILADNLTGTFSN